MANIFLLPVRMDISIIKGDSLPNLPFKVVDADDNAVTTHEPELIIQNPITGAEEQSIDPEEGITVDGSEFVLDAEVLLDVAEYRYALQIAVENFLFTVRSGNFNVRSPFELYDEEPTTLELQTLKLPIVWVEESGSYRLQNTDGTDLLNTDGETPLENNP